MVVVVVVNTTTSVAVTSVDGVVFAAAEMVVVIVVKTTTSVAVSSTSVDGVVGAGVLFFTDVPALDVTTLVAVTSVDVVVGAGVLLFFTEVVVVVVVVVPTALDETTFVAVTSVDGLGTVDVAVTTEVEEVFVGAVLVSTTTDVEMGTDELEDERVEVTKTFASEGRSRTSRIFSSLLRAQRPQARVVLARLPAMDVQVSEPEHSKARGPPQRRRLCTSSGDRFDVSLQSCHSIQASVSDTGGVLYVDI